MTAFVTLLLCVCAATNSWMGRQGKIRTVFTISLLVTVMMTIVLVTLSGTFARFYGVPELARYIKIIALGYAFEFPILGPALRDLVGES